MQIKAIYNKGKLEMPPNIRLSRETFPVRIEIPPDVITESKEKGPATETRTQKGGGPFDIRGRIDAILGSEREEASGESFSSGDYKKIWKEHLEEKYIAGK